MQIVIPMSGFGERFRRAGYSVPKPLIKVDGKPIIAHVIDMFPGETDFIFICNQEHLANSEYGMAQTLRRYAPTGKIVGIPAHKLGPVNAVLKARAHIDPERPVIVNYCDFTCYWDYNDFKNFLQETNCDGAIPAYKGFHPHSLGSTFYAYMQHEGLWLKDIQEKTPYTDNPMDEYASSGTYFFRTGELCLEAFERQVAESLSVNGEYYASLAYKVLLADGLKTAIYDLQHFMQWGTPADLEEYMSWSHIFRRAISPAASAARQDGSILIPMAGLGSRFAEAGFKLTKPLIPVSGRAMVVQAAKCLPAGDKTVFITRRDMPSLDDICLRLRSSFMNVAIKVLEGPTDGQIVTCMEGLDEVDLEKPLTIGACDNGLTYNAETFERLLDSDDVDVIVWTVRGHPDSIARPKMFGWVEAGSDGVITGVSVKKPLKDPATDHMITGAFTFRRGRDFLDAAKSLLARNHRVNGEFYVDSAIEDALALGLKCKVFEVDGYIGWGTPKDLAIFEYWQSCFHKWEGHPYRLEKDFSAPPSAVEALTSRYAPTTAPRPTGVIRPQGAVQQSSVAGEAARFVPVGIAAVIIDSLVYAAFLAIGAAVAPAKASGFISGAIFAYFANRRFTFRRMGDRASSVISFIAVYLSALFMNVAINSLIVKSLSTDLRFALAFLVATAVSATMNFIGMKFLVFTGERISA